LEKVAETIEIIQSFSSVPVCLDTEGAQVRTGSMADKVVVSEAEHVRLTPNIVRGTASSVSITPASVFSELQPNNLVTLDFDGVMLLVLDVDASGVETVVINGGKIGSNKAVVIVPPPTLPALSEKDREAVAIGRRYGVTHYALSFANSAEDVAELRELAGPDATIISKIESKRGVLNLDAILAASDEILIDRGDLSRECHGDIRCCEGDHPQGQSVKVPVHVATNLLNRCSQSRRRGGTQRASSTRCWIVPQACPRSRDGHWQYPVAAVDMVST
jgi:pyruvate kinase